MLAAEVLKCSRYSADSSGDWSKERKRPHSINKLRGQESSKNKERLEELCNAPLSLSLSLSSSRGSCRVEQQCALELNATLIILVRVSIGILRCQNGAQLQVANQEQYERQSSDCDNLPGYDAAKFSQPQSNNLHRRRINQKVSGQHLIMRSTLSEVNQVNEN